MAYEIRKSFISLSIGMLWHMRLGHPSLAYLRRLQKIEPKLKMWHLMNQLMIVQYVN